MTDRAGIGITIGIILIAAVVGVLTLGEVGDMRSYLHQTELRRCEKCGSHYHASDNDPITQREAWPENEPEIMPSEEELFGKENEETEIKSW